MANPDSVAQYYLDAFGNGRIAVVQATQLNTAGNAVIAIPFLNGGLTKGNTTVSSGSVIVRRITVNNPSGSVASANVTITTSNDGNTSNAVVAATTFANLTATGTYQDLTIASPYSTTTAISGVNTSALFVNVNTASGNNNTVTIAVYGDVVQF
jgi:hypothetical protein